MKRDERLQWLMENDRSFCMLVDKYHQAKEDLDFAKRLLEVNHPIVIDYQRKVVGLKRKINKKIREEI